MLLAVFAGNFPMRLGIPNALQLESVSTFSPCSRLPLSTCAIAAKPLRLGAVVESVLVFSRWAFNGVHGESHRKAHSAHASCALSV
jgi:hypothetical protein